MVSREPSPPGVSPPAAAYGYTGVGGLPLMGSDGPRELSTMTSEEVRRRYSLACRVGYGNFDTAKPDQTHFGRKLHDVLVRSQAGEYQLLLHREQWIRCEEHGVRIMQFIQWVEFLRADKRDGLHDQATGVVVLSGR